MRGIGAGWAVMLALVVAACTPGYREVGGWNGVMGYKTERLDDGYWRVSYAGNGFTTHETAQTYWLYRCAELTIEQGYDGFEVLSHSEYSEPADRPVRLAASAPVIVPMYSNSGGRGGYFTGDIRLLKKPFDAKPPRIFDAVALKNTLQAYVTGETCDGGNVCHHAHTYLYPPQNKSATQQ